MTPQQRRSVGIDLLVVAALLFGLWLWSSLGERPSSPGTDPTATSSVSAAAPAPARSSRTARPRDTSGLPAITLAKLPSEARATLQRIDAGGPFPYARDGVVFQNRERILPRKDSGYYHEYTVPTPGEGDRGARRIITGRAGELYWTADHYDSFSVIVLDPTEAR
jgi:ribonuclease T1